METKITERYAVPEVLASYSKEELEEAIQPHGDYGALPGCGGGLEPPVVGEGPA